MHVYEFLVLIAYAQNMCTCFNAHAVIFSEARSLNCGQSLHLHSYFVYARLWRVCPGLPEHSLLDNAISKKRSCAG